MKLSEELAWRGFVNQTTLNDPTDLDADPIAFYWGVDPSAPSMTVGNLAIAMMVRHFIDYGNHAVLLVGGATGLIGDPDGKSEERSLKSFDEITANKQAIVLQYNRLFAGKQYDVVDNYDWFKDLGYLEFLRDIGKHVPMRQMLGREFVQKRLSDSGAGISYAEFSYSLIQGYDFLYLHRHNQVKMQVCGADQWGNSLAGVELIRRIDGAEAHVWSAPLVINKSTGIKFGKSEDGAIWLDEKLTSIYRFYQFWLNTDDDSVEDFLKIFTLLSRDEITQVMHDFLSDKAHRSAQKALAFEVTRLIHGEAKADAVRRITDMLFGGASMQDLSDDQASLLRPELPFVLWETTAGLSGTLVRAGIAASNSDANRLIDHGAVSINGIKVTSKDMPAFPGRFALVKCGKNRFAVIERQSATITTN